jgi:hypothetical protein
MPVGGAEEFWIRRGWQGKANTHIGPSFDEKDTQVK